jgi:hypothetical protein
MNTRLLLIAL